ncbi:per1-like protein PGAP5 isoform X1 [Neodiprion pinetum]|uniref:per1-like protein PGAP5 isoform X1 n=1 Tax=Neodiprion pinetum TaxID=441929 RepID=UPI001EDD32E6|nr:metallophosphoesterase 1 isoform X1 [Neodiprion pinetum]
MDGCDISLRYVRLGYLKLETINELLQSLYTQGILRPGYLVFLLRVRRSLSRNFSMWVARSGCPKSRSSYSAEQCRRAACESDVFIRYSLVGIQKRSLVRQVKKGFLLSRILMFVREWQMYRAFQTAMTIHKPELVFILGDIFDEGLWCSSAEFDRYVARFNSLFYIPQNTQLYVVAGNHDMGFHYKIIPYLNQRFVNAMNAPSVKRVSVRGNHFVLMNSMALEGDGCFLCKPTEMALNRIAKQLKCTKGIGSSCKSKDILKQYSKPILLQHYPMYRESDEICHEVDEAPANIKSEKFRERWECLSKEASEQLLDIMEPRLIVNGHTHHGCRRIHRENILEFTVPSFSWRNKNNPSFLLGVFTPNNYSVSKCYMPVETTVIGIYIIGSIVVFLYLVLKARRGFNYRRLVKLHP